MRTPQRVSAFVASQVGRREFLRRTSTMALGIVLAPLGGNRRTLDPTTIQRVRSGTPTVLSAAEVVALGLPLYLPDNQFQTGPDCPCDCSWGCQWRKVGSCYSGCRTCGFCMAGLHNCATGYGAWRIVDEYYQCFDCCDEVCGSECRSQNQQCLPCCTSSCF